MRVHSKALLIIKRCPCLSISFLVSAPAVAWSLRSLPPDLISILSTGRSLGQQNGVALSSNPGLWMGGIHELRAQHKVSRSWASMVRKYREQEVMPGRKRSMALLH